MKVNAPKKAIRYEQGAVILNLRVIPGAKKTEVKGLYGATAFHIKVAAPPVEGKANKALFKFLAEEFEVSRGKIQILSGETSRDKVIRISSVEKTCYSNLVARWGA